MRSLEHLILQNYWTYIAQKKPLLTWKFLPGDETSYISIILIECNESINLDNRQKLLEACNKAWYRIAARGGEELTIEILTPSLFDKYLKGIDLISRSTDL